MARTKATTKKTATSVVKKAKKTESVPQPQLKMIKNDPYLEPFTDGTIQEGHRWWSLSFYDEGNSTLYLGQHHFGKRLYNTDVKFCFKFMSDNIPNTRSIFIANSKKYICEKIETDIDDEGINKLMTGYFFELES